MNVSTSEMKGVDKWIHKTVNYSRCGNESSQCGEINALHKVEREDNCLHMIPCR